jgi:hypothetical protein
LIGIAADVGEGGVVRSLYCVFIQLYSRLHGA